MPAQPTILDTRQWNDLPAELQAQAAGEPQVRPGECWCAHSPSERPAPPRRSCQSVATERPSAAGGSVVRASHCRQWKSIDLVSKLTEEAGYESYQTCVVHCRSSPNTVHLRGWRRLFLHLFPKYPLSHRLAVPPLPQGGEG